MKMSTKGRYALRIMLDLAIYNTGEPITLKDIAKRQNISEKYLEQIISALNKADFVKSVRGASGGYMLKERASSYTVGMILRATEGDLTIVNEDEDNEKGHTSVGATSMVWKKMSDAINEVVDNITLQDMVEWQHEADQAAVGYQYFI